MKKIISLLLTAVMMLTVIAVSAFTASADSYITFGDWELVINGSSTYMVGGYKGSDTDIAMPEKYNNRSIIGVADDFSDNCSCDITSVTLPESYVYIGSFAFFNCASLESVNIPSNLSTLGDKAFSNCTSLTSVDLSPAAGLKTIPFGCFLGCVELTTVVMPQGITNIDNYAFSGTKISSFELTDSVTSIGSYCFKDCSQLSGISLGEKITNIPDYAFYKCSNLQSIVVPASVTSIGNYSFYECVKLKDVELPPTLTTIGIYAFFNDLAMNPVYIPISVSSIGGLAFNVHMNVKLECYKNTYAEEFAYENYIQYTSYDLVKGDADDNDVTNIRDVTYIQLYRVGKCEIGSDAKTVDRVDVTGDHQVNVRDATKIQLYLAHLVDSL